jgi:ABC-type branched-subunit amino acid transport system permease subunit
MKSTAIRSGVRTGFTFGLVVVFIFLIGFTATGAGLVAKLVNANIPPNTLPSLGFFIAFTGLIGLWCGAAAVNKEISSSWGDSLLAGGFAGLISGVLAGILAYVFGLLNANKIDPRVYLVSLTPTLIQMFLMNLSPLSGALANLGLFLGCGVVGGLLAALFRQRDWLSRGWLAVTGGVSRMGRTAVVRQVVQNRFARYGFFALLAAALIILPRQWGSYWNYVLGTVGIYILLGLGLNIITGLAGQLVIGYVAFFAIGAYSFSLLSAPEPHHLMMNFWPALLIGVLAAAVSGFLLGLPILNLRGDYLAIVTLGFAEIVRILLKSDLLTSFTGGPRGLRDIGGPTLFGQSFTSDVDFMYLIIIAVMVVTYIAYRLQNSHAGRNWVAIREDETVARATGIHAFTSKLLALAISAAIAGLAGALFASRNQFTGPDDHALIVSINVICLVIVGGIGSIPGIFLGAFALKGLPEVLREIENYRMLVFGALLVVMMRLRPEGFWPATRPSLDETPPTPAVEEQAKP